MALSLSSNSPRAPLRQANNDPILTHPAFGWALRRRLLLSMLFALRALRCFTELALAHAPNHPAHSQSRANVDVDHVRRFRHQPLPHRLAPRRPRFRSGLLEVSARDCFGPSSSFKKSPTA